jgi:hypothetical protein
LFDLGFGMRVPGIRKRRTVGLFVLGGCAIAIFWYWLPKAVPHPALDEYTRAQRLADLVAGRRGSLLRAIPIAARSPLIERLDQKAFEKKRVLDQSGELEAVILYAPDLPERRALLSQQRLEVLGHGRFVQVMLSDPERLVLRCLPEMITDLQHRFCYVTNHIARSSLTSLCQFNSEDIACRLPDGTEVDLAAAQKWLNESVAARWRVGISRRGTNNLLIVMRERTAGEAEHIEESNARQ